MKTQLDFFNSMADKWDDIIEIDKVKIDFALNELGIQIGDSVLDIGTGTGVMLPFLLNKIGESGSIVAIDIAENMLKVAKSKFEDENRIKFQKLNVENDEILGIFDYIMCYCVFPHFNEKVNTIKKLMNENLKVNGKLMIFHPQSKEEINNIHKEVDDVVAQDKLINAKEQIKLFKDENIHVCDYVDDKNMYMLILKK